MDTIHCREALDLAQNTRMGELCYSRRHGVSGGSLIDPITVEGKEWAGSEFTVFAMTPGSKTDAHIDGQMVHGKHTLLPAAGIMLSVNRWETGPAKTAVIVSREHMDEVIRVLRLDILKPSSTQCPLNHMGIDDVVQTLKDDSITFAVVSFPQRCSYAIPRGCAHFFVTHHLVETVAWHPTVKM